MKKYQCVLLFILSLIFFLPYSLAATPQNPLVTGDALYVSHSGVHKFNQDTLELEWSALQGLQTFEPVMGNNLLYVGSSQGLYALDAVSGQQVWHIEETRTIFSPNVARQLYAGSLHGGLFSINPLSGRINWQQQFSGWIYSPVVLPDQDQLWTGGQAHQALALSTKDGRLLHTVMLDQESIFSPLYLQNEQVAFNLFNGKTAIINTVTAKVDGWLNGSTQPKNINFDARFIYRSNRDGTLTAFDRNNYRVEWQQSIVAQDLTMHPTAGGHILMSDLDKILVLFDPIKRTEVWRKQISGNWFAPAQIDTKSIIYIQSSNLQPNNLSAVKVYARPPK
jgi:outer membrane protein assembly factor BamB